MSRLKWTHICVNCKAKYPRERAACLVCHGEVVEIKHKEKKQ